LQRYAGACRFASEAHISSKRGRPMRLPVVLLNVLGFALTTSFGFAAEQPKEKLPDDGWWIRYGGNSKQTANEQVQEHKGQTTYSLVGTVVDGGQTYRWIEHKTISSLEKDDQVTITKFLVPEKDLLESDQPVQHYKRGWIKLNDRPVTAIKVEQFPIRYE